MKENKWSVGESREKIVSSKVCDVDFIIFDENGITVVETDDVRIMIDYCTNNAYFTILTNYISYGADEFNLIYESFVDIDDPNNTKEELLQGYDWCLDN